MYFPFLGLLKCDIQSWSKPHKPKLSMWYQAGYFHPSFIGNICSADRGFCLLFACLLAFICCKELCLKITVSLNSIYLCNLTRLVSLTQVPCLFMPYGCDLNSHRALSTHSKFTLDNFVGTASKQYLKWVIWFFKI